MTETNQILYKLTNQDDTSYNQTKWGPGVSHSGTGYGELCGEGWIHAYEHPLLAVIMNPVHGDFENPKLWLAEGVVAKRDGQLKCGCQTLTTLHTLDLPQIHINKRVELALRCIMLVYTEPRFTTWADAWLCGDRCSVSARLAGIAADYEALYYDRKGDYWAYKAAKAAAIITEAADAAARGNNRPAGYDVAYAIDLAEGYARTNHIELNLFELADKVLKENNDK